MKNLIKSITFIILTIIILGACFTLCACGSDRIVVYTNAFFAPFEYYDGTDIVGVDVEIMNLVGKKLNKKVTIKNVDFGVIIDEVASGKLCDCGAAGITVTQSRLEKVNFSIPYYTSVQYVIFEQGDFTTLTADDGTEYVLWSELAGKKIGTQLDTTGDVYVDIEINGDGDYVGELAGTGAESIQYDNAQLAVQALVNGKNVFAVVIDQMPAIYLAKNYPNLRCVALYYDNETATTEEYAIAVNKSQNKLLDAINEVLTELLVKDENGESEIDRLIAKHFGINDDKSN